jgi:sugar-specific transcriptional regulator TrmB
MSDPLQTVRSNLESRIAEIDRQLAATDHLREEREHLARALEEVAAVSTTARTPRRARRSDGASRAKPARRPAKRRRAESATPRASQGVNRDRIVAQLRESGPSSASAVAKATGINRAVVYNNLGKLVDDGTVAKGDADGVSVFQLVE